MAKWQGGMEGWKEISHLRMQTSLRNERYFIFRFLFLCLIFGITCYLAGCSKDRITTPPDEPLIPKEKDVLLQYHPEEYLTMDIKSAPLLTSDNHLHGWQRADCTKCHRSPSKEAPEVCINCHGKNGINNQENTCSNCHKVVSMFGNPPSGQHQTHVAKGPKDTNCEKCHPGRPEKSNVHASGIQNIVFDRGGTYELAPNKEILGACKNIACHEDRQWGGEGCSSCHDSPPNTGYHAKHLAQKDLSCQTCHEENQHDSDIDSGSIETGGIKYNLITGDCASDCHKTQKWRCTDCHDYPPENGNHSKIQPPRISLLGRQFLPNDVGFWQIDGARLGIKNLGTIDSRFYGGVAATPWMVEKKREGIAGIELSRLDIWRIQSRISFLTVFDKSGLNNVILGMRLDVPKVNIFDVHRDVRKRLSFFGRGSIDLLTQQVISGYGYIHFSPLSPMHVSLEYQHETPLFPADSIFSIFAFEPLQQAAAVCEIDIFNGLELRGRYIQQFFDDDASINQYSAGFSIKRRYERVVDIRLERLSDIHTKYWRIHSYIGKMLTPRLKVGFNHYYNNYKLTRALQATNVYSYQLNVKYQMFRNLSAFIRIEDNINTDYVYNVRVMGYIRIFFEK